MRVDITVPDEMLPYKDDLEFLFRGMLTKLWISRSKGFNASTSVNQLLLGLDGELAELAEALREQDQFAATVESLDAANFLILIGISLLNMPKGDYKQLQAQKKGQR